MGRRPGPGRPVRPKELSWPRVWHRAKPDKGRLGGRKVKSWSAPAAVPVRYLQVLRNLLQKFPLLVEVLVPVESVPVTFLLPIYPHMFGHNTTGNDIEVRTVVVRLQVHEDVEQPRS